MTEVFHSRKDMIVRMVLVIYRCVVGEIKQHCQGDPDSVYEVEVVTAARLRPAVTCCIEIVEEVEQCKMPLANTEECAAMAHCLKPYIGPAGNYFAPSYLGMMLVNKNIAHLMMFVKRGWLRLRYCTTGLPSSVRAVIKRLDVPFVTEQDTLNCSLTPIEPESKSVADHQVANLNGPSLLTYYRARARGHSHAEAQAEVLTRNISKDKGLKAKAVRISN